MLSLPCQTTHSPVKYTATLQARKGNYRVVVNVRDKETGKMGTTKEG